MAASPANVKLNGSFALQVTSTDASSQPIPGVRVTLNPSPLNDAADPYSFVCTGASSSMVTDAAGVLRLTPCRFSKSPREGTVQVPITATGTSATDSQLTDSDTVTMVLDVSCVLGSGKCCAGAGMPQHVPTLMLTATCCFTRARRRASQKPRTSCRSSRRARR